jgi:F-type H+-transporting ATPase subunit delta
MAESATIARPYAKAAFEQAQTEGDLRKWAQMLHFLSAVVSDPLMRGVLDNPRIPDQQLLSVVLDICAGQLSETGRNFVTVLSQAGRLALAPEISVLYDARRARAEGTVDVEVISAYELDDAEKLRIAEIMKRRVGMHIEVTTSTDKSLIGGVIIRAGDSVIDASLKGRLNQLKNDFAA